MNFYGALNLETAGVNYLGFNPTLQTKQSDVPGLTSYKSYRPSYNIIVSPDFDIPDNSINNNPAINSRYVNNSYKIPNPLSIDNIRGGRDMLNPFFNEQTEFHNLNVYGYSASS